MSGNRFDPVAHARSMRAGGFWIDKSFDEFLQQTVAATPGEVMRLPNGRMAPGAPAGLVLTRARTINELLSRPQTDRVVLYAGKQIDRRLPDYRELD